MDQLPPEIHDQVIQYTLNSSSTLNIFNLSLDYHFYHRIVNPRVDSRLEELFQTYIIKPSWQYSPGPVPLAPFLYDMLYNYVKSIWECPKPFERWAVRRTAPTEPFEVPGIPRVNSHWKDVISSGEEPTPAWRAQERRFGRFLKAFLGTFDDAPPGSPMRLPLPAMQPDTFIRFDKAREVIVIWTEKVEDQGSCLSQDSDQPTPLSDSSLDTTSIFDFDQPISEEL